MADEIRRHPFGLLAQLLNVLTLGGTFSLTVTIDGMLVTGMAIGAVEYYTVFEQTLSAEGTFDTVQFAQSIRSALEKVRAIPESDPSVFASVLPIAFYMRDVTILTGGGRYSLPLWTGRFDAITGWDLGTQKFG
jgi:hypothetical protein